MSKTSGARVGVGRGSMRVSVIRERERELCQTKKGEGIEDQHTQAQRSLQRRIKKKVLPSTTSINH